VQRLLLRDERTIAKRDARDEIFRQFYKPKFADPLQVRKLKFINQLAYAMERVGGQLRIEDDEATAITLTLGNGHAHCKILIVEKGFALTDPQQESPSRNAKARWVEEPGNRIETHLRDIVLSAALTCWEYTVRWRESDRRLRLQEEARVRALAEQVRAAEEREAINARKRQLKKVRKQLVSAARGADEAAIIRKYVEQSKARLKEDVPADELDAWAVWALSVADELDPWKEGKALKLLRKAGRAVAGRSG